MVPYTYHKKIPEVPGWLDDAKEFQLVIKLPKREKITILPFDHICAAKNMSAPTWNIPKPILNQYTFKMIIIHSEGNLDTSTAPFPSYNTES